MSNTSGKNQEKGKSDLSRNEKKSSETTQTNEEAQHDNQNMHTDPSGTTVSQVSFDDDSSKSMPLREAGSSLKGRESCKEYESPLTQSRSGKSSADPSEESSLSHKEGMSTSEVTVGCVSDGSCFDPSVVSISAGDSKSHTSRSNQTDARAPQSGSTSMAFKLLVSNNMAGSIIGRSGKTISDLQVQSASRIKLSQNGTYYPGTTDRVCLIQGPNDNVKLALNLILQQLHDLYRQQINQQMTADPASNSNKKNAIAQHSQNASVEGQENFEFLRENETTSNPQGQNVILSDESDPLHSKSFSNKSSFVVRVLIPIACSGLIIGRAGCNVKSMAETSGVSSIRLAPKDGDDFHQSVISSLQQQQEQQQTPSLLLIPHQQTTSERIVTISAHDLSSCIKCCHLIIDTMALQPDLSRYINMTTNYSKPATATNATILTSTQTKMPDNVASFVVTSSSNFTPSVASAQQQQSPVMGSTGTFSPNEPNSFRLSSNQPHQNIGHAGPMNHQYPANILRYSNSNYFTNNDGSANSQSNASIILPSTQMPISNLSGEPGSYSQTHHQPPVSPSLYLVTSQTSRTMFVPGPTQAQGPNAPSANQPRQPSSSVLPSADMQTNQFLEPQRASQGGYEEQVSSQITQQYASSRNYVPVNRNRDENQLLQSESDIRGSENFNRQGAQQFSRQMAVPDYLIGAILGPGGKTLSELQITTNTNIKISQRGVFVPGTNDRIVTISGTYLNITNAQYFITQRLTRSANRISPSADISAHHPQQRSSSHSKNQLYNREDSS